MMQIQIAVREALENPDLWKRAFQELGHFYNIAKSINNTLKLGNYATNINNT